MESTSVTSAGVYQVRRVIDWYKGKLRKGVENYTTVLINLTDCLHRDWPRSRGYDLSGVIVKGLFCKFRLNILGRVLI